MVTIGETEEAMEILAEMWDNGETHFQDQNIAEFLERTENRLFKFFAGELNDRPLVGIPCTYVRQYERIYKKRNDNRRIS